MFHNGDYSGVTSFYMRFPADGLVIAILANQSHVPRDRMFQDIVAILNDATPTGPGPDHAQDLYQRVLTQGPEAGAASYSEMNAAGYRMSSIRAVMFGNTLLRLDRRDDARAVYTFMTLAFPTSPYGFLALGRLLEEDGAAEEAATLYHQVLTFAPDDPMARSFLDALEP